MSAANFTERGGSTRQAPTERFSTSRRRQARHAGKSREATIASSSIKMTFRSYAGHPRRGGAQAPGSSATAPQMSPIVAEVLKSSAARASFCRVGSYRIRPFTDGGAMMASDLVADSQQERKRCRKRTFDSSGRRRSPAGRRRRKDSHQPIVLQQLDFIAGNPAKGLQHPVALLKKVCVGERDIDPPAILLELTVPAHVSETVSFVD